MTKDTVSFKTTPEDRALILKITARGAKAYKAISEGTLDTLSASMDITACHANGNPLRLQELLDADDFNFSHDFFGIIYHIDRETGKMLNCFSPRFTKR